jgi:hypothetical protein
MSEMTVIALSSVSWSAQQYAARERSARRAHVVLGSAVIRGYGLMNLILLTLKSISPSEALGTITV